MAAAAGTSPPAPKDLAGERLVDDPDRGLAPHSDAHHRRHVLKQVLGVFLQLKNMSYVLREILMLIFSTLHRNYYCWLK